MKTPPRPRVSKDPREVAEAAFRRAAPLPDAKPPSLPGSREMVSLRIDREILDHFQKNGPGWQDRINEFLRQAIKA